MNTKKLLSMLLVSLGAFSVGLTGCVKPSQPSSEPTPTDPAPTPDSTIESTPAESTPAESTPAESTPAESTPAESTPAESTPAESTPAESTPAESTPAESTPAESTPDVVYPESTIYDVTFNYDSWQEGITVWTDYAIDQTIAPDPAEISEMDLSGRHTVPITEGDTDLGSYYFAIDANGYIVYASYGLGLGYGGPGDGYYHNQDSKDPGMADNWALHEEWAAWPNKTEDGRNAWSLYDFLIPTDGFVVKGYAKDPEFVSLWKLLTGQIQAPVKENNTLEYNTAPKALDKWYFSINENHELEVRERLDQEKVVDGEQEFETLSKNFESTDADEPIVYNTLEGVGELADNTTIENTKVVVVWARGNNAIVQDVQGNNILVFDAAMETAKVGDTLVLGSAVKVTYNGYPELKTLADVTTLPAYGKLPAVAPTEVTAENVAEVWVEANNYGFYKLVKAEVIGEKQVKLGDTTIDLYSTTFPETVKVGDFVDITLTMQCYKGAVQGKGNTDDISRYYNISFDVDGVDETAQVVHAAATGAELTVSAKNENENYVFSHWAKVVLVEEEETLEKVSDSAELKVTVGETDEEYVAVYTFAPWSQLEVGYAEQLTGTSVGENKDSGADALSVITDESVVLHADGAWTGGLCNTSWRFILAVDAEGKVAYAVLNPANGFGGPNGDGYYAHPDYADYTTNPTFNILEGYGPWVQGGTAHNLFELKVPEGGFIVLAHGTATNDLVKALSYGAIADANVSDAVVNNRTSLDDSARVFYDSGKGEVKVFVQEVKEGHLALNDNADTVRYEAGTVFYDAAENKWINGVWANYMIVDADGVIAYNVWNVGVGYGLPGGFYANEKYATENPCVVANEDGTVNIVVPEGFTGLKFGYGDYLNSLYSKLSFGYITHSSMDAAGNPGAKNWNSLENSFISKDARVVTNKGWLHVIPGTSYIDEVPQVYNDEATVTAAEICDYTIAIDGNGKVIYAGYGLFNGYSGPGDGFYHDGTYAAVAGQLCGIFDLQETWAPWEQGKDNHTHFTLKVPEGGYIITGNNIEMKALIEALLPGQVVQLTGGNGLFENDLADGDLNNFEVKVGEDNEITVTALFEQVGTGLALEGIEGEVFTWNEKTGAWEGTVLIPKWTNFSINFLNGEETVSVWYDNTTMQGDVVAEPKVGDQWNGGLFIDSDACVAAHQWMNSNDGGATYKITYNPSKNILVVVKQAAEA